MIRVLCLILALLFNVVEAQAHSRSESFSVWEAEGKILSGVFSIEARRATLLYGMALQDTSLQTLLINHLNETISLSQEGMICGASQTLRDLPAKPGSFRIQLTFECPKEISSANSQLHIKSFFDISPSHVHGARVDLGERWVEALLTSAQPTLTISLTKAKPVNALSNFVTMTRIGAAHVLSGLDHMAFLLALMLLCTGWRMLVWTITAFTGGHSITLALVALEWVRPASGAIELMIGFSILVAAMDSSLSGDARKRSYIMLAGLTLILMLVGFAFSPLALPSMVFIGLALYAALYGMQKPSETNALGAYLPVLLAGTFGLVHGAGFAASFLELDMRAMSILPALLAFNIGVELGQLVAFVSALAVYGLIKKWLKDYQIGQAQVVLQSALIGLGMFWFVSRALSFA